MSLELMQAFRTVEDELDLFDARIDGVRFWERIRFTLHRRLEQAAGAKSSHQTPRPPWRERLQRVWTTIDALARHNPYTLGDRELLVLGHPRRKPTPEGRYEDIYTDPLLSEVDVDHAVLEPPTPSGHRTPAVTDDVRYLDPVTTARDVDVRLGRNPPVVTDEDRAFLERIEDRLEVATGHTVPVAEIVEDDLHERRTTLPRYRRILDRVQPAAALVVVAYSHHTFVEACRSKGVPTVELQHGSINPYHLAYAFPEHAETDAYPDQVWTFGRYWKETVDFPLPDEAVSVVGFPHVDRQRAAVADVEPDDRVLFISQAPVGHALSRLAARLADHDLEQEIVYKLHPAETDRYPSEYPELASSDATVIGDEGGGPGLYELFASSTVQVGVYSTALFEGLTFSLRTFLLDHPGVERMEPLVERGTADVVEDAVELAGLLEDDPGRADVDPGAFFAPEPIERMREQLGTLLAGG